MVSAYEGETRLGRRVFIGVYWPENGIHSLHIWVDGKQSHLMRQRDVSQQALSRAVRAHLWQMDHEKSERNEKR